MKIPLWWVEGAQCACPNGASCTSPGKHPLTRTGVKDASDDPEQLATWQAEFPRAHWGLATGGGSGVVVIDLDKKPGKDGVASLRELAQRHGGLPRTRMVRTGSGGLHLYFRHPGGRVPNSAGKLGPGIDVRGDDGYVVAAGSGHVSGGRYTVLADAEIADPPEWLIDLIRVRVQIPDFASTDRGYFPAASPAVLEQARDALDAHGPAIEGQGGDQHTFRAAALLVHDFALTDEEAWPLLEEWNDACQPSWDEDDLRAKLHGGGKYGKAEYGRRRTLDAVETARKLITDWQASPDPAATMFAMLDKIRPMVARCGDPAKRAVIQRDLTSATGLGPQGLALPRTSLLVAPRAPQVVGGTDWAAYGFDLSNTGAPIININNAVRVLEKERHPIWFDEFRQQIRTPVGEWTDANDTALALDLQRRVGLTKMTPQIVNQAVIAYARRNPKDPVRDELEALVWDGVERIERCFLEAFGAEDSEYVRRASANFWRSLVVRVFKPGEKVNHMVVLEGDQGIKKSSAAQVIAGPGLFAEASESPHSKDFFLALQGKILVEVGEMDSFSRGEVAAVKRVLSCREDRFRAPYERTTRDWPRRGIFIGTTNRSDWARDDTGARRFWPIRCVRVDLAYLRENRDQLLAEAVANLRSGATWWEMPAEATAAEQEARRQSHPWEEILANHFAQCGSDEPVTVVDLLRIVIGVEPARMGKNDQMQMASVLRQLGFERVDGWRDGRKQKFWRRREVGSAQPLETTGPLPTFPPSHQSNT